MGTTLVTQQIIGQVQEAMVPFFFMRRRQQQIGKAMEKTEKESSDSPEPVDEDKDVDISFKRQAALEGEMEKHPVSNV